MLELYDAFQTSEDYNRELRKRLRIEVGPQGSGLGVRMKLKF
jgi:hypothetical protein